MKLKLSCLDWRHSGRLAKILICLRLGNGLVPKQNGVHGTTDNFKLIRNSKTESTRIFGNEIKRVNMYYS